MYEDPLLLLPHCCELVFMNKRTGLSNLTRYIRQKYILACISRKVLYWMDQRKVYISFRDNCISHCTVWHFGILQGFANSKTVGQGHSHNFLENSLKDIKNSNV